QLQKHSDDMRVRAALGLSFFMLENYPKALETLRTVQAEVDDDPGLAYAYAVSLVKTGEYMEGVRRLKSLNQSNPNSADVHMLLGEEHTSELQSRGHLVCRLLLEKKKNKNNTI